MSYPTRVPKHVEDSLRAKGKELSERGKHLIDAMAFATGVGKTVNQYGEETIYGGARREGKSAFSTPIKVDVSGFNKELFKVRDTMKTRRSEKMAVINTKPGIQLETDKCGRYHFAKAFLYRDVETKHRGPYREQIIGYGVSRRQHGDPKDSYVGEGLAVSRALEDLGYKLGKRSWGKVRHNDDIKVQRKQQKARRQAKAKVERESSILKLVRSFGVNL